MRRARNRRIPTTNALLRGATITLILLSGARLAQADPMAPALEPWSGMTPSLPAHARPAAIEARAYTALMTRLERSTVHGLPHSDEWTLLEHWIVPIDDALPGDSPRRVYRSTIYSERELAHAPMPHAEILLLAGSAAERR